MSIKIRSAIILTLLIGSLFVVGSVKEIASASSCGYESFTFNIFPDYGNVLANGAIYSNGQTFTTSCGASITVQTTALTMGYSFFLWSASNGGATRANPAVITGCNVYPSCDITVTLYLETVGSPTTNWCCHSNEWNYPNKEIVEADPYSIGVGGGESGALYMDEYQNENLNNLAWNFSSTLGSIPASGIIGYGDVYYGIGQFMYDGTAYWEDTSIVPTMKLPMSYSNLISDNLYIYSEYHVNNNDQGRSMFSVTTDNWLFPAGDYMVGNYPSVEIMIMPFEQNYPGCTSNCPSINGGTIYVNGQAEASSANVFRYWCNANGVTGQDGLQVRFGENNWGGVWLGFDFSQIAMSSVSFLQQNCGTAFPSNMWLPNLNFGVEYGSFSRSSVFSVAVNNYYTASNQGTTDYLESTSTSSCPPYYYTVVVGDYLSEIGAKLGVQWQSIALANNIVSPYTIDVGEQLIIPGLCGTSTSSCPYYYTVQPGDYLSEIGEKLGVSWQSIAQANNIQSPYVIYQGEELLIPGLTGSC